MLKRINFQKEIIILLTRVWCLKQCYLKTYHPHGSFLGGWNELIISEFSSAIAMNGFCFRNYFNLNWETETCVGRCILWNNKSTRKGRIYFVDYIAIWAILSYVLEANHMIQAFRHGRSGLFRQTMDIILILNRLFFKHFIKCLVMIRRDEEELF